MNFRFSFRAAKVIKRDARWCVSSINILWLFNIPFHRLLRLQNLRLRRYRQAFSSCFAVG